MEYWTTPTKKTKKTKKTDKADNYNLRRKKDDPQKKDEPQKKDYPLRKRKVDKQIMRRKMDLSW
jgi:hypothetical protein